MMRLLLLWVLLVSRMQAANYVYHSHYCTCLEESASGLFCFKEECQLTAKI